MEHIDDADGVEKRLYDAIVGADAPVTPAALADRAGSDPATSPNPM